MSDIEVLYDLPQISIPVSRACIRRIRQQERKKTASVAIPDRSARREVKDVH